MAKDKAGERDKIINYKKKYFLFDEVKKGEK